MFLIILIKSLIIGVLVGVGVGAGAAGEENGGLYGARAAGDCLG
ncbi:Uncharacterised protein [Salmonella enterica]|uniref:Uncharacterized protein n=1 Tax=Salmonella enterica subsp. arizonae TaxID=59203 RepID=A0A2X4TJH4_SALER|nr:Uncharacterised protein [Salmonella enterica subsp. arizonae]SUF62620.1 Uncharacterised protein [Salmonella enterica]SUG17157.1 Uncharacterised protein [Salmonella enterica subsp. arizonae]SUG21786.1 Uncharacterised protein [Salmonella enterica subsp. arizonae]SUG26054.1 Uncharacterised protein [Salmonella enterica subsp. arizonae]